MGTLYRDAVFIGDPDSEKTRHLLDSGMVEEIGDDGQAVTTGTGDKPAPSPAKPGSEAPQVTARSTKPELVDYAVAQGQDRAEAEKLTVKELQERYVRQQ